MGMAMTAAAARRVAELAEADGRVGLAFRVMVTGGGCQGFQYVMDLDDGPMEGDAGFELDGARLLVDGASLPFVDGATLDWVETLAGDRFEVRNPNAASSCGCGVSFG